MDFFDMGGYGGFIWLSYAITFMALIWLFLASWQRAKTATRHLQETNSQNHNTTSNQD